MQRPQVFLFSPDAERWGANQNSSASALSRGLERHSIWSLWVERKPFQWVRYARSPIANLVVLALLVLFVSNPAAAATNDACARLSRLNVPLDQIVSAERVSSGSFKAPNGTLYAVKDFCRVQVRSQPSADSSINIEVWLPAKWSGRFYQLGNGYFSGFIDYAELAGLVNEGNAVANTDDGHSDPGPTWSVGHPEKIIDFAWRAQHETTRAGKALVAAYFGTAPRYSYFIGCSGGGRHALIQAQRFPQEWNGILAGAPATSPIDIVAVSAWNQRALRSNPTALVPLSLLGFVQAAALRSCSPAAHVIDGIASDPRQCWFNPATLVCKPGQKDSCLSSNQALALEAIYDGPLDPLTGTHFYPGFERTAEAGDDFQNWIVGTPDKDTVEAISVQSFYANMVLEDPAADVSKMDLQYLLKRANSRQVLGQSLRDLMDATNPDLSGLRDHGGKLIIYHGWADGAAPPRGTIRYYDAVVRKLGRPTGVSSFFRLFMVPGMGHCGNGAGASAFGQSCNYPAVSDDPGHNIMRALEAWVEHGRTPDGVVAVKYEKDGEPGGVKFSRPLCAWPRFLTYSGQGDRARATSFRCVK